MASSQSALLWLILGTSAAALVFAVFLSRWVLARDRGTPAMQRISNAIQEGAEAFLARQYKTIGLLSIVVAALIYVGYAFFRPAETGAGALSSGTMALYTTVAFLLGAVCSGFAGFMGMWVSIRTNIRTAAAATHSLNAALQAALRGGAVSGLFTVAMSLIGVAGMFGILNLVIPDGVAADAVRMFVRMDTHMPMKPAKPEHTAPSRNASVVYSASVVRGSASAPCSAGRKNA